MLNILDFLHNQRNLNYPPPLKNRFWQGYMKFLIKSVGEEYQVVRMGREGNIMAVGDEYNIEKVFFFKRLVLFQIVA